MTSMEYSFGYNRMGSYTKFEKMSVRAFKDPSTGGNPVKLTSKDFLQLYRNSFDGIL